MMSKIKVGIIGATGYAGEELLRILFSHPDVEIAYIGTRSEGGKKIGEIFPQFSFTDLTFSKIDISEAIEKADVFFLALPHSISLKYVPPLYKKGKIIIDLSADYRFDNPKIYENYYVKHTSPELLSKKVYGLPEIYREKIKGKKLIANPGCYPTSVILGLAPILGKEIIEGGVIIVDSKSGASGAGRNPTKKTLFSEINENLYAYSPGIHRHQGEMEQEISNLSCKKMKVLFVPHLAPYNRGILSTIYVNVKDGIEEKIYKDYKVFYRNEPFVKVLPLNELPSVNMVRGTNFCIIGIKYDKRTKKLIIVSVIDNLTKGASGQAVQNFNIVMGIPEERSLINLPVLP